MGQPRDIAKSRARIEAQRARILDAARKCFSERGFHGASIAAIADTAGMSQGLIYRYFTNKAAIIRAITDEQRRGRETALASIHRCDVLIDTLLEKIEAWRADRGGSDSFDAAMFLEVTAESTRDPEVAAVVSAQEQSAWHDFSDLVQRSATAAGQPLDEETLRRRTILVRCLVDGVILCVVRDPSVHRDQLRESLHEAFARLGL